VPDTKTQARIAFIGCGHHSTRSMLPAAVQADNLDLVAVCDLDEQRARAAARKFGARNYYTDAEQMLDREHPQGVIVIGTPQMQFEVGKQVLARGIPVLVEKPPALNSADADEFSAFAAARNTWGMVAFMKRFAPAYRIAKEIVSRPEFEGVHFLDAKFSQGSYRCIWGLPSPAVSFLTGQVVHIFDLIRFFGGDLEELHAFHHQAEPEKFGFAVSLRFASGAIGVLNLNSLESREAWRGLEERLNIAGREAALTVEDMLYLRYQSPQNWVEVPGLSHGRLHHTWQPTGPGAPTIEYLLGYRDEIAHFADCLLKAVPASPSLADGAEALRIGEAVWQSVATGHPTRPAQTAR